MIVDEGVGDGYVVGGVGELLSISVLNCRNGNLAYIDQSVVVVFVVVTV